jgi:hypothetical protein
MRGGDLVHHGADLLGLLKRDRGHLVEPDRTRCRLGKLVTVSFDFAGVMSSARKRRNFAAWQAGLRSAIARRDRSMN